MKKLIALLSVLTISSLAQTSSAPAKSPAKATTQTAAKPAAKTTSATKPASAGTQVTNEEVDAFLKHMFGFQPGLTMKVLAIEPSEAPSVTKVTVQIGEGSQVLYVLPGGKFAMVGDMIPFGTDPFAPARTKLDAGASGPVRGDKFAPVTLVEFTDLQCPHCKTAQPFIEKLAAESPNAKLIYQPFPLPMHPWAKQAAAYAECVSEQSPDALWKFNDSVYAAQEQITEANATEKLNGLAGAAGANAATVATCALKPETAAKVQKSIDLGLSVGVGATPTLFIQGRKVMGISNESLPQLKAMIDYEAQQKK